MKQSLFLTVSGILGGGLVASAFGAEPDKHSQKVQNTTQPNVVIIMADDIGYGDFSCNGAVGINTPNIDKLAETGINFRHAHAAASTSTPSRYSLLTGEYNWRRIGTSVSNGDAAIIINPIRYTMPKMFKEAGYTTAAVGKWHLGLGAVAGKQNWNGKIDQGPTDIGFDYSYIMAATADRVPCVFIENQEVVGLDPSDPIQVSYSSNFAGEPTGASNPEMLKMMYQHGHDGTIVNGISRIGFMKGGKSARWIDENISDSIVVHAVEFIERNQDKPFFLYMGTNDAHVPRAPHPRFVGKSKLGPRGDAIVEFDDAVGQVVAKLDELNLRENTLIIVTSDNGAILGDGYQDQSTDLVNTYSETDEDGNTVKHKPSGPFAGTKYSINQGGTAIPCVLNWQGRVAGRVSNALVSQVDLLNTFAALIGVDTEGKASADSQNQLEAWLGNDDEGRDYIIQHSGSCLAIYTRDWKYIEPNNGPQTIAWAENVPSGYRNYDQLFNISADIRETENLASVNFQKMEELKSLLNAEKAKGVNMSLTAINPESFVMSTAEKPVWFMIHDNRANMSFLKVDGEKVNYTRDLVEVGKEADNLFFRMEVLSDNPNHFVIKSKVKGENYIVGRSDADETLSSVYTSIVPNSSWTFLNSAVDGYKQIKSLGEPSVKNNNQRICLNTRIELNKVHLWIDAPTDVGNQFAAYRVIGNTNNYSSTRNIVSGNEKIWVEDGIIKANIPFKVFNLQGQEKQSGAKQNPGVYIVKTANQSIKLIVK
ncbi:MAG TPA: sulfatase-like hydrolase/transferase [Bacteroidales bacterium]|nr:sulfatase-like hydrolase/transferase [Bacteroidales bacterium]